VINLMLENILRLLLLPILIKLQKYDVFDVHYYWEF
jgi:hypothetical protein